MVYEVCIVVDKATLHLAMHVTMRTNHTISYTLVLTLAISGCVLVKLWSC